jgi:hypothetical protein
MYKEVLESIQGISLYGIISICLFFIFFAGVLVWSCALKKNYLNTMGNLPLEEGNSPSPRLSRRSASEGGGEGEPVSTPPAFSPMGNHPQKL